MLEEEATMRHCCRQPMKLGVEVPDNCISPVKVPPGDFEFSHDFIWYLVAATISVGMGPKMACVNWYRGELSRKGGDSNVLILNRIIRAWC